MQQGAGEDGGRASGRADAHGGIFRKDQLAALEIVVEVQRHGEGAIGRRGRAVVAMRGKEVPALRAVRQYDMRIEGELAVEGEDFRKFGPDPVGQPVGYRLQHHRLDDRVVLGALQRGHVDIAVAAGDAGILVVALAPQPDELGAEIRLEDARQNQHGRHRGVE